MVIAKWLGSKLTVDDLISDKDAIIVAISRFRDWLSEVEKDSPACIQRKKQIKYIIEEMVERGKISLSKKDHWQIINEFCQEIYNESAPQYIKNEIRYVKDG